MRVINYANLAPEQLAEIESELPEQRGLQDVVSWGLKKKSGVSLPGAVAEVVVQDEFTHDAVVPWRDGPVACLGHDLTRRSHGGRRLGLSSERRRTARRAKACGLDAFALRIERRRHGCRSRGMRRAQPVSAF